MSFQLGIVAILGAFALYPFVMRGLANSVQSKRLDMAKLGVELLSRGTLNPKQRRLVGSMLKDAYDFRVALLMAVAVPVFAFKMLIGQIDVAEVSEQAIPGPEFDRLANCHVLSVAAANPILFVICVVEILFMCLPVIALKKVKVSVRWANLKADFNRSLVYATTKADKHLGYGLATT